MFQHTQITVKMLKDSSEYYEGTRENPFIRVSRIKFTFVHILGACFYFGILIAQADVNLNRHSQPTTSVLILDITYEFQWP